MSAATKPSNRRRVTRRTRQAGTCQGQQTITTDLTPTLTTPPTAPANEPVKKKTQSKKKSHRSDRADDWAHTTVGDPKPCVLCGSPAMMRHPHTGRPCHLICATQLAHERGEQW